VTLSISITRETEERLRKQADAAGKDVSTYVAEVVEQAAAKESLDQILSPLRREFAGSGTSDEQLTEEITIAQTAYRAEQQKKSA